MINEMATYSGKYLLISINHLPSQNVTIARSFLIYTVQKWSINNFPDTCDVPDVTNGYVRKLKQNYYSHTAYEAVSEALVESGLSLYVSCDRRHSLSPKANTYDGKTKITCIEGAWDSEPVCKPSGFFVLSIYDSKRQTSETKPVTCSVFKYCNT